MSTTVVPQQLPDLAVLTTQGNLNLADLRQQAVLLYFYPKDATPGCTTQARDFRELMPEFTALGVRILGVSRDSMKAHEKFTANECLPFALISDTDETLCRLYDVIQDKNMYGKVVQGIVRSSFLYNAQGELVQQWNKVKPAIHAEELLNYIRQHPVA
jgi:thioredoxin-dependent peroxiredoxin